MTKIALPLTLLVTALVSLLPVAPVQAAAARTFVSSIGSDSNNCTNVATPCRHLATAYAATTANGEIYVLDPANYGALTINGPVSIEGHGWASIAPVSGSAAITINANPGDKINIIGVVLDGTALTSTTGIQFNSGGSLTVRDSVIRNFTLNGISFQPNTSNQSQLFVSNTLVSDNGGDAINISPAGSGTINGVVDHVQMENNSGVGLYVNQANQAINVFVGGSVIADNQSDGISAVWGSGPGVSIMVRNSTISNNASVGLEVDGTGATIRVTRSTITGNNTGWAASVGVVLSYGDNNIDGNTNVNTEPPNPLTYK
jgi:Right handed beta helix region